VPVFHRLIDIGFELNRFRHFEHRRLALKFFKNFENLVKIDILIIDRFDDQMTHARHFTLI
jgi:hypothetical protein